jgi:hypothetical protein
MVLKIVGGGSPIFHVCGGIMYQRYVQGGKINTFSRIFRSPTFGPCGRRDFFFFYFG